MRNAQACVIKAVKGTFTSKSLKNVLKLLSLDIFKSEKKTYINIFINLQN